MIEAMFIVWFLAWVYKNFPRTSIKAQFKRKLKAGKWGYAQLDFETYTAKDRRETIRKEFDRVNESVEAYQQQVDNKANKDDVKELFRKKIEETNEALKLLKEKLEDADRGIKMAEDTKDELHYQEKLLKTYIERNY